MQMTEDLIRSVVQQVLSQMDSGNGAPASNGAAKSVAVVIPARNEEAVVGRAVESLLNQNYPGSIHVFLVDDHSTDATVSAAGSSDRLTIVPAGPLPQGWTGKLWAVSEGLKRA